MQCIYVRLEVQLVEIACYKEAHTFNYFLTTTSPHTFFCNKLKINNVLHTEPLCQHIFWLLLALFKGKPQLGIMSHACESTA